jgi:hypothetical protein
MVGPEVAQSYSWVFLFALTTEDEIRLVKILRSQSEARDTPPLMISISGIS